MSIFIKPLAWDQYDRADIYHVKPTYGGGPKAFMLSRASRIFSVFFDTVDEAKAAAEADYTSRIRSALVATPPAEPDFAASIAETITEECAAGAACGWRSCTGCHETNEGAETGHYPYSKMFGCHVGSGCSECGGLGVVWEHWSEDSLNEMAADVSAPTPPAERVVEALPNWNGWRSIDTAPEDCRVILATAGGWVGEAIMLRDEDTGEQVWTWVDTGKPSLHSCYGWMPLPAPLVAPVLSDLRPDGFDGPTGAE